MDRRRFVWAAAGAAALAADRALAANGSSQPGTKLFATGPLAKNTVASAWLAAPGDLRAPDVTLVSDAGPRRFSQLKGKVRIVSLWGEWCTPCLIELHDLAELRKRQQDSRFDIMGIAQATKLDAESSRALLSKYGAPDFPTWLEAGSAEIATAAATPPGQKGFSMPCNLLLDEQGRIRGRAFGTHLRAPPAGAPAPAGAHVNLAKLIGLPTVWSSPDADAFAMALKQGALDHARRG